MTLRTHTYKAENGERYKITLGRDSHSVTARWWAKVYQGAVEVIGWYMPKLEGYRGAPFTDLRRGCLDPTDALNLVHARIETL